MSKVTLNHLKTFLIRISDEDIYSIRVRNLSDPWSSEDLEKLSKFLFGEWSHSIKVKTLSKPWFNEDLGKLSKFHSRNHIILSSVGNEGKIGNHLRGVRVSFCWPWLMSGSWPTSARGRINRVNDFFATEFCLTYITEPIWTFPQQWPRFPHSLFPAVPQ